MISRPDFPLSEQYFIGMKEEIQSINAMYILYERQCNKASYQYSNVSSHSTGAQCVQSTYYLMMFISTFILSSAFTTLKSKPNISIIFSRLARLLGSDLCIEWLHPFPVLSLSYCTSHPSPVWTMSYISFSCIFSIFHDILHFLEYMVQKIQTVKAVKAQNISYRKILLYLLRQQFTNTTTRQP